jgi:hypothetical protein
MQTKEYTIVLTTEMLGTVPKDPEIYKTYIESKRPKDVEQVDDEYLTVEKIDEKGWTGFHQDEDGLFLYEYMIKGFLKNAGNVLKDVLKTKALKSKIDNFLFVSPRKIRLCKSAPDSVLQRPLRAMTMQGPRVSLAKSDLVNAGTKITFKITLLPHKEITWKLIDALFEYGMLCGLGQFRNGGYGRFEVLSATDVPDWKPGTQG